MCAKRTKIHVYRIQGGPNEQMSAKYEIENLVGVGGGHYGGQYDQQSYYGNMQQGSYYQQQPTYGAYDQQQGLQHQTEQQQQQATTDSTTVNTAGIDVTFI